MGDRVGPPAQEVDVNPRGLVLSSCSARCCSLAVVLLHFHTGFWQPAEASCPLNLRGSQSSGQKSKAILLWLQSVLTQAVTAAQAVTTRVFLPLLFTSLGRSKREADTAQVAGCTTG